MVKDLPHYRRIMPYFLRHKYESIYYWKYDFNVEAGLAFMERFQKEHGIKVTFTHLFMQALLKTMIRYPNLNRFAKGGKIYQRKGIWFSFSVKKESTTRSKVSIVKKEFKPCFTLIDTIETTRKSVKKIKAGKGDQGEKESKGYLFFPGPIIRLAYPFYRFMDEHGLFTKGYMEKEVLYASAFINNVGVFGAAPAYHHLYEIGTITQFFVIGAVQDKVVAENERPLVRKVLPVKATIDERAEDAFYYMKAFEYFTTLMDHPERLLGPAGGKGGKG
ncbi:MAG: hypothetical protein R6V01_00615 [Thermoplasmatota archaeon]